KVSGDSANGGDEKGIGVASVSGGGTRGTVEYLDEAGWGDRGCEGGVGGVARDVESGVGAAKERDDPAVVVSRCDVHEGKAGGSVGCPEDDEPCKTGM
ncbi:unnamed protein product, partial [Ilex paraguariensis]